MPALNPNQILAMLQARGVTLPPNALQLIQSWQSQRAEPPPGAWQQNLQTWRARLPQMGQGQFDQPAQSDPTPFRTALINALAMRNAGQRANPAPLPMPISFPNPMLPTSPVTAPGVSGTPFNPAAGKGGGVGRTMTGGNPNFAAMAY